MVVNYNFDMKDGSGARMWVVPGRGAMAIIMDEIAKVAGQKSMGSFPM